MIEELIPIRIRNINTKGLMERVDSKNRSIVLVLHPHPLYGGDMNNPVVSMLSKIFHEFNLNTFRFNFRGVSSRNHYDGITGAVEDVKLVSKELGQKGFELIGISGYSFGGSTALRFCSSQNMDFVISISSSLALLIEDDFPIGNLSNISSPVLMIHGVEDFTVPFENMYAIASQITGPVATISIENEGHFFHKSMNELEKHITLFMEAIGFDVYP